MLVQFVTVFLQVLVSRSHDLLQEEIGITLYNMAAVDDFHNFYTQYLRQFLAQCDGVDDNQRTILATNFKPDKVSGEKSHKCSSCRERTVLFIQVFALTHWVFVPLQDLPSFTQGLQRFVNDLRYYQLCNSSLPAGSVKL